MTPPDHGIAHPENLTSDSQPETSIFDGFLRLGHSERIILFLRETIPGWIFLQALALVGAIGFVDYITGYEVTVFPFYSIPILLALWFGNQRSAVAISIFSVVAWWGADKASGHLYSQEWLHIWDTIGRCM